MKRKAMWIPALILAAALPLAGCLNGAQEDTEYSFPDMAFPGAASDTAEVTAAPTADTSDMDFTFDKDEEEEQEALEQAENVDLGSDSILEITKGGSYTLTGEQNGMILVDAGEEDVTIVLNGAVIRNESGPAVYIRSADEVTILAAEGTENVVSDGASYSYSDGDTDVDAAIFSKADLTITGTGSLKVVGNAKHGIVSKDDLIVTDLSLTVEAVNVALNGKDCVKAQYAELLLTAGSDGIRSDNDEDADRGYIYLENSTVTVKAGNDGIQAETVLRVSGCVLDVTAGSGSARGLSSDSESYKGLKAGSDIQLDGATVCSVDSQDDAVHSNGTVTVTDGSFTLSSGDDGIHADSGVSISGGTIDILKSYEGIEGLTISVSGGKITVNALDDGLNAASGNDGSGFGGRPGMGSFSGSSGSITISGGYLLINAQGDGVDSNGSLTVTGGVTLVSGPTNGGNGALDYNGTGTITGGVFVALGSQGMAMNFSSAENQGSILAGFQTQRGGTSFSVLDGQGNVIVSFTPEKDYSSATVSAPGLKQGGTYTLTAGASVSGTDENGFAQDTKASGGTALTTVKLDTLISGGGSGMGGFGGGGMPGGQKGQGGPGQGGFGGHGKKG